NTRFVCFRDVADRGASRNQIRRVDLQIRWREVNQRGPRRVHAEKSYIPGIRLKTVQDFWGTGIFDRDEFDSKPLPQRFGKIDGYAAQFAGRGVLGCPVAGDDAQADSKLAGLNEIRD